MADREEIEAKHSEYRLVFIIYVFCVVYSVAGLVEKIIEHSIAWIVIYVLILVWCLWVCWDSAKQYKRCAAILRRLDSTPLAEA